MKRIPKVSGRPRLDVRDLQLVLAVSSGGSTVKAATSLHLTQSAVSRGLLLVEEKLGVRLFERTPRGLAPTPAGARLLSGATTLLEQLAELESQVGAPEEEPTRIRLVCECYTAYRWLPSALANLHTRVPGIEISLAVEHTSAPVAGLSAGEVDIALLTTAAVRGKLQDRPLFADEIVFVMASSHPLAARPALVAADLRDYPLITSNTPPAERRWFQSTVFGDEVPKLRYLPFPLTEAIMDAARAGMGIAVLSEWIAGPYLSAGGLTAKRLASGPLQRHWRIAYRPEAANIAQDLIRALADCAPKIPMARVMRG